LFLSKTLPRRSKAQSGAWRNGTWLGLTDLEALLTVAREAHSAQQVTDRRRSIRFRWECRFDFDHVMRLDYLMAVGRVLQLRVGCSLSEQGENLNLVLIFAQFREPGKNTQLKSDVLMKWTSLTGKRWVKNHQYSILVPSWCQNTLTHHDPG
jgi:hypothetical protein